MRQSKTLILGLVFGLGQASTLSTITTPPNPKATDLFSDLLPAYEALLVYLPGLSSYGLQRRDALVKRDCHQGDTSCNNGLCCASGTQCVNRNGGTFCLAASQQQQGPGQSAPSSAYDATMAGGSSKSTASVSSSGTTTTEETSDATGTTRTTHATGASSSLPGPAASASSATGEIATTTSGVSGSAENASAKTAGSTVDAGAAQTGGADANHGNPNEYSRNGKRHGGGLSGGAIAGIVIGVVAGLAIVALAVALLLRRHRRRRRNAEEVQPATALAADQTEGEGPRDMYGGSNVGHPGLAPGVDEKRLESESSGGTGEDGGRHMHLHEMESGRDSVPRMEAAGDEPIHPGARTAARAELPG